MKNSALLFCLLSISLVSQAQKNDSLKTANAPRVIFQNCLDKPIKKDFYKGRYLVLDFCATWCAPCIGGFPKFNELADKFGNENVIFASMTDEPQGTVRKFFKRTQKQLHALKLSDTTKTTLDNFKISSFPSCVIIGPDNTIRWSGATHELTSEILAMVINNQHFAPAEQKVLANNNPGPQKTTIPLFYFNISNASDDSLQQEHRGSYRSYKGVMSGYISPKVSVGKFLEVLTGFPAKSRIITNDTLKLKKFYAIDFKIGIDSDLYKSYRNIIFQNAARKNFIISTVGNAIRFDASVKHKKIKHFELYIIDAEKLNSFRSMQNNHSSMNDDYLPKLEIVNYNLESIANYIEMNSVFIVTPGSTVKDLNYDVSLDLTNIDSLKKSLQFHGLGLKELESDVEFLDINFY